MTRAMLAALLALVCAATSARAEHMIAEGEILVTTSHTNTRSITVLTGAEGIDGFLFDVTPYIGECITTRVVHDGGGLGHDLAFNFHRGLTNWRGGCDTSARDEKCIVPDDAFTGEVTGDRGTLLRVEVLLVHDREGCRAVRR